MQRLLIVLQIEKVINLIKLLYEIVGYDGINMFYLSDIYLLFNQLKTIFVLNLLN